MDKKLVIRSVLASGALLVSVSIAFQSMVEAQTKEKSKSASPIEQGKELAFDTQKGNCLACHLIPGGESPGNIGPPLVGMKARFPDREALKKNIYDQTQFNPRTIMPSFGKYQVLTDEEIGKIIDFLYQS